MVFNELSEWYQEFIGYDCGSCTMGIVGVYKPPLFTKYYNHLFSMFEKKLINYKFFISICLCIIKKI